MKKANILIVEDDLIIAAHISTIVENAGFQVAEILTKGESAISFVAKNKVDVILMDIQLAGQLDGIEAAKTILQNHPTPILFLTANIDDATFQKSKAAQPLGFISKPFKDEELLRTVELILNNCQLIDEPSQVANKEVAVLDRVFVRDKDKLKKLRIDEILYVEAERNYCTITTKERSYTLSVPLKKFKEKMDSSFFARIHRSFLVNLKAIDALDEHYVFIKDKSLPVSKTYKTELNRMLTLI